MKLSKPCYPSVNGEKADRYRTPKALAEAINAAKVAAVNGHAFKPDRDAGLTATATRGGVKIGDWRISAGNLKDATIRHNVHVPAWYVDFRDHRGRPQGLRAFTDREASAEFGRRIEKLVALRATKLPLGDLAEWLEGLSKYHRKKFSRWGLLRGS